MKARIPFGRVTRYATLVRPPLTESSKKHHGVVEPPLTRATPSTTSSAGNFRRRASQYTFHFGNKPSELSEVTLVKPAGNYTKDFGKLGYLLLPDLKPDPNHPSAPTLHEFASQRPMLSYVQLLATPTADTPGACLLLHFENHRYVFGSIAEGTQRVMVQRKVGLSKAESFFVTGPICWHNTGGLLGMILTIADSVAGIRTAHEEKNQKRKEKGQREVSGGAMTALNITGGKNLSYLLATARRFIFRRGLPLRPNEVRTDPRSESMDMTKPDFEDKNIMVWYVPVFPDSSDLPRTSPRKRSHTEISGGEEGGADKAAIEAEKNQQLVESVVTHMFDSDWQMDALIETTLHKAKLPAALFVRDEKGHIQKYEGPLPGGAVGVPDRPVLVRQPWPGALVQSLPRTSPVRQSMCYIVKNQPRRGKFDPKAAEKYGVAKQDYKKLTGGQTVTGKDGMTITPDMVIGATVEGAAFAVVDVPETSYIRAFLARPEWASPEVMKSIVTMFWNLGSGVVANPEIRAFMRDHSKIRHVVSSPDTCANVLALESPARVALTMNRVDPARFPLLSFDNVAALQSHTSSPPPYQAARVGAKMQLAPQQIYQEDDIVPLMDTIGTIESVDPEVLKLAEEARIKISDPEFLDGIAKDEQDIPNRDADIIPLGTGSSVPSKYRNVSATLVRVPGVGNYLFDCGENTLGQVRRMFGPEGSADVLADLRAIWISHLHADHHLGTASVIRAWRDVTASRARSGPLPRLVVASHVNMLDWLREYADVEDYGFDRLHLAELRASDLSRGSRACRPYVFSEEQVRAFGLTKIEACRVDHCHGALATVFRWPSGLSIAYSGDCRPSQAFVEMGKGATLLIHESTFDDEMAGDAKAKKHSTMSEALDVGRRMGARRILLTHFSQRYPKIPIFDMEEHGGGSRDGKEKKETVVLMAFDHMRVKLGEFKQAAAFLPALQKLYENEV